ncbi:MAG: sigma-54-dependent transcriptional regulator [Gemmatimonadota bacterium]
MNDTAARVMIVDDEAEILENLDRLLSSEGYLCTTLQDPMRFRDVRAEVEPDVLITDLRMPGADGMTILAAARADDPHLPVILITGFGTISSAVEAMQEGAFDYLAKPFTADQLLVAVERAVRHRRLVLENRELKEQVRGGPRIVGSSAVFTRVLDRVRRVAPTDANVLITGESGTGKEVIARLVHEQSRRADGPFVPVDCASLPEGLLESELFGHEKGAFTGAVARKKGLLAEANGGTVFLDEIGELSMPLQAKLLRALEQRQIRPVGDSQLQDIDVRVIAATNRDLVEAVAEGTFREDLYYRLNVVEIRMPPLRERWDDLPQLAGMFLKEAALAAGREVPHITPDAWAALERYDWPGNIRQLRNVMHRLVALHEDRVVSVADLPREIRNGQKPTDGGSEPGSGFGSLPLDYQEAKELAMQRFMEAYLDQLLHAHGGNVSSSARTAGVSRRTLHRWLAEYGRPT